MCFLVFCLIYFIYSTDLLILSPAVGVGPASVMVGNLVAGKRIAQAAGRDLGVIEDQDLVRKVAQPQTQELTFNLVSFKQKPAVHYMHACPAD